MTLSDTEIVTNASNCSGTKLFACFELCKLLPYITEDSQLTIIEMNRTSIWEEVNVEWLTKVRSIIEKSLPSPKSYAKLLQVMDLWRRATVGYLEFRDAGSDRCRELPDWLNESAAEEIRWNERRAAEIQQNAILKAGGVFWFCDAEVLVGSDPFTSGKLAAETREIEFGDKARCWWKVPAA